MAHSLLSLNQNPCCYLGLAPEQEFVVYLNVLGHTWLSSMGGPNRFLQVASCSANQLSKHWLPGV